MEKKAPRWYILWFIAAALWLAAFCANRSNKQIPGWEVSLQLVNSALSFLAGLVNARRHKRRRKTE